MKANRYSLQPGKRPSYSRLNRKTRIPKKSRKLATKKDPLTPTRVCSARNKVKRMKKMTMATGTNYFADFSKIQDYSLAITL